MPRRRCAVFCARAEGAKRGGKVEGQAGVGLFRLHLAPTAIEHDMNRKASQWKLETAAIVGISIAFMIWSGLFIYRSSFISIDGRRYFCLFDDAMISMRYAWNFSHGLGLVWNPGERVEGYTNLLMTLLMAFPTLIFDKSTAVLSIQIAGVGFMLGIAYLSMRIADHIVQNEPPKLQALARVLAFLCALAYYPLAYWTLMGMETGLLTVLLLSAVLAGLNYAKSQQPTQLLLVTGSLGLAYLTRNDSLIFAVPLWAYIIWATPGLRTNRKTLYHVTGAIGIYFLFIIGQFTFQYLYYGDWLPNTYTLKLTGLPLLRRLKNGVKFILPFMAEAAMILVLSGANVILHFRRQKLLLLSFIASAIAYEVYAGGDAWNYWRITAPCMPLLGVLLISFAITLGEGLFSTKIPNASFLRNPIFRTKYLAGVFVTSVVLLAMLSANWRFLPEFSLQKQAYQVFQNQRYVNMAVAVSQVTTSDATVGVIWAGSIPYYTGRTAIDFLGKSDRYIAHLPPDNSGRPGHDKYDLRYSIKTLLPTFVQRFYYGDQDLSRWAATRYVTVDYEGVKLFFLKDSPAVLWNKVHIRTP